MSEALQPWFTPALVVLLGAAGVLVVFTDWRLSFVALGLEYVGAAVLVTQLAVPEVAAVKLVGGLLVVGILALTGWQANFGRSVAGQATDEDQAIPERVPTGLPFRVMAALMIGLAALYVAGQPAFTLPGLEGAPELNTASYALMALGLLNLGLTEEPLNAGMGLLTVLIGFEIFYVAVEPALAIVALLAGVEFAVALAASYLVVVQRGSTEGTEAS
jgi:hypothetical protein